MSRWILLPRVECSARSPVYIGTMADSHAYNDAYTDTLAMLMPRDFAIPAWVDARLRADLRRALRRAKKLVTGRDSFRADLTRELGAVDRAAFRACQRAHARLPHGTAPDAVYDLSDVVCHYCRAVRQAHENARIQGLQASSRYWGEIIRQQQRDRWVG